MDSIVARFQPRALHSEIGVTLYKVVDTRTGVHIAWFTREALASLCAARMNRAEWTHRAEAGTW